VRSWTSIPLGAMFRRVEERDAPELPLLSVYRDFGVVLREGRGDNYNRPGKDLTSYKVVRPGDLVLNKMKTWQGSLGVSELEGIVSPAYFVGRQVWEFDLRFLHHLLRSAPLIAEYAARSKGIRPSQWDLSWDEFKSIRVNLPPMAEQRRIAGFLDAETARIDGLIAKKGRLLDALRERLSGFVEHQIRGVADDSGEIPLKFAVPEVTVGIVITPAKWYSDEGVPAIRGTNVLPGRIDMSDMVYLTPEGHSLHTKSALCEGDLVVVRTGQAGSAAVVPRELDGANCIDVLLIRQSIALLPRYLEYVINSDWTRKHIEAHSVGTIQSHFNVGALRELRIPVPGPTVQEDVVRRLDKESDRVQRLTSALAHQIDLLAERRQALITAAVTGDLDVVCTIAEDEAS